MGVQYMCWSFVICGMRHLLDMSLLWLGAFQFFPTQYLLLDGLTSSAGVVGHFPTVEKRPKMFGTNPAGF